MVTEERLVDELRKQKVGIVRKLCKACNIDSKGSRDDLILRLRNEMKNRHSYDKVFQKIWGASGGWAVIACPHGIVYSLKFNLRAESPRDFADLLMSWKHLPNVSVYDFARGLTTHTNLRFPDVMPFQPNEGRLAECTPDNITAAQKGKLEVSLSWLLEKKVNPDPESHPTTGSSCHFALYDKFHESNTKDQRDVLRRINLVPELQGWLNSQVVEQLFGVMKKNNYFLNNMAPSTHVFMMRNIIHHRNVGTNQQLLDQQLHKGLKFHHMHTIALNEVGQAVLKEAFLSSTVQSSTDLLQERSFQSSSDMGNVQCGLQCEALTTFGNIKACRSSWTLGNHPNQEKLLSYVLDSERPGNELIVRIGKTCLTREDFLSLGTSQDMEATIGNCCFELITEMAKSCGKDIFIADLYVVPTWLPPHNCDPMLSLPNDAPVKDLLLIPIWVSNPGHFMLCWTCKAFGSRTLD
ncbi:uncharacterized protein LOC125804624 [Astyanax mexicanus]|uniref:uncharacterized protein LOC125804624 n=1 Tax=Astyanax mexicanus TaxID=7994 RepID=UPI0020CAFEAB|nr:uncharacterized protein LOC125804624 [Astyanax mexicanus]